jgi:uncharacterized protein
MKARSLSTLSVLAAMLVVGPIVSAADSPDLASLIQSGDRVAAMRLIRAGADVNLAQVDGTTALHWAVFKVDPELTQALLQGGAKPNVKNVLGSTPLAEAVKVANVALVRLLLMAGADPEGMNEDGQTALMLAARTGVLELAQLLVRAGGDVNAAEAWRGQTPLMWAAAENHPDMVEYLIKKGAKVGTRAVINDWQNQVTSEPRAQYRPTGGLTPFLYAVRGDCLACVIAMLKAGADINLPTPDGVTPLMSAIDNLNFDVARYLLEQGANPHIADWWGRTALYIAVDMKTLGNRLGGGAFGVLNFGTLASERGSATTALDMVRLLLEAGVNPNTQLNMHRPGRGGNSGRFTDDNLTAGSTPLLRAAITFDNESIELLLKHGALVDLPNVMGVTPLMMAGGLGSSVRDIRGSYAGDVQSRALPTLDLLIKAGADVNARVTDTSGHTAIIARPSSMTNRQGQTVLYGAINWGWPRVVKFLLDHGARVDIKDDAGKSIEDALVGKAGGRDHKSVEEVAALIRKAAGA